MIAAEWLPVAGLNHTAATASERVSPAAPAP